ncbi:MAG: DUF1592 domain-containing protein [Planctomycetota bacterium]|nr:DUF1592 domain-containing protein [Planctomycetota bacterium]
MKISFYTKSSLVIGYLLPLILHISAASGRADETNSDNGSLPNPQVALLERFCMECHDAETDEGEFDLESILTSSISKHSGVWEKVVQKLNARHMPPLDSDRPSLKEYESIVSALVSRLDYYAVRHPEPGPPKSLHRLTRTEYQNVIRDLLALDIDAGTLLPADEPSHGFDNITVDELSPVLLNRYVSAAQKISRIAVGTFGAPVGVTFRPPADETQEDHVSGLPLGTRGGMLVDYHFPQDGIYEFQVHLTRDRNEMIAGLNGTHTMEVLLNREKKASFEVRAGRDHTLADANLKKRVAVKAGPRKVGVTFIQNPKSLIETKRKPYVARFNYHRHPRQNPAVFQLSITGPFDASKTTETPSQKRIMIARPKKGESPDIAARKILEKITRLAYRRPVTEADLKRPMAFFQQGFDEGDFDTGIESALSSILVSPRFLFRVEQPPKDLESGETYALDDIELASRLSFFLWSRIPDEELLSLAEHGKLSDPDILKQQVQRMLADPRSRSLVTNFANQWLYLRNLDSITPNHRLFPDFDDNLRQAFRIETELFIESIIKENCSLTQLLHADYTFLNERLAKHYQIPNIYGTRFRKVSLKPAHHRGGLLRHGSILTVTSYATRTSPVLRGNWVLENILGSPAPPPPDDVPELEENRADQSLSIRERLSRHRANAACASCHNLIDPIGFALENYDAIGRWRTHQDGVKLDVSGSLPDGQSYSGIEGLEKSLLARPELFVTALTEKLMTFGLGRGVESTDGPAIRKIVKEAAKDDYRFSSVIFGIVNSVPFRMSKAL